MTTLQPKPPVPPKPPEGWKHDAQVDQTGTPTEAQQAQHPAGNVAEVADVADPRGVGSGTHLAKALDETEAILARFVAFPSREALVAVTLWAAHTHAVDAFDSSPRLALLSPEPGSGKSRTLEILDLLVPAAMHVLSASPAAIFRSIDHEPRPTLLFDEVDAIFGRSGRGDDNEDLRGLLNAGHRHGATIPRCVGPTHDVRRFPVYAAVALAGLGDLPDTVMTRSVVIRMRRRLPSETVSPYRIRLHEAEGHAVGAVLADAVAAAHGELADAWPAMPPGIEDRPADVWEPLLAVADVAGGRWPERARAACSMLAPQSVGRSASLGIRLLADLRSAFGTKDRLSTAEILERLHAVEEAPWSDLRGKPLDARGLARMLDQYGVTSTTVRIGDRTPKGYLAADLADAWQRYTPGDPQQGQQTQHGADPVADVAHVAHPTPSPPEPLNGADRDAGDGRDGDEPAISAPGMCAGCGDFPATIGAYCEFCEVPDAD